eukprot:gene11342-15207_t
MVLYLLGANALKQTSINALNVVRKLYLKHPMVSNSVAGFFIFGAGDLVAQSIESYNKKKLLEIDYSRMVQTGTLGIFMNGVTLHFWYKSLDRVVGSKLNANAAVICKVIADQVIYAPFAIVAFFSYGCITNNNTHGKAIAVHNRIVDKLRNSFLTTYLADCTMWPMVNAITFKFIPLVYRPSFVGIAQIIWQTYMSCVSHSHSNTE